MDSSQPRSGFGKLWAATTVSNLGDGVMLAAAPLLAATLTRDPLLVALVVFSHRLPWLMFTLLSGALVDRVDRRRVMWAVDAFRTALIGALGLAVWLESASIPLLCMVFFFLGTAETLFDIASQAILPQVVPVEDLGLVARSFGLAAPFWMGCVLLAVTALLVYPVVNNRAVAEVRARRNV